MGLLWANWVKHGFEHGHLKTNLPSTDYFKNNLVDGLTVKMNLSSLQRVHKGDGFHKATVL